MSHFKSTLCRANELEDIKIYANADYEALSRIPDQATVYIRATWLTKDQTIEPHLHEHYGITAAEALMHGYYPVVYEHGGLLK